MNSVPVVIRLFYYDMRQSLSIFWAILLSIFVLTFVLMANYADQEAMLGGGIAVYVFSLVAGAVTLNETFFFALGLHIRRSDYFIGTVASFGLMAAFLATLMAVLGRAEKWLAQWADTQFTFFSGSLFATESLPVHWMFSALLMYLLAITSFLIAAFYFRFRRTGMIIAGMMLFLLVALLQLFEGWHSIGRMLGTIDTLLEVGLWAALFCVVNSLISYLLLRKITV